VAPRFCGTFFSGTTGSFILLTSNDLTEMRVPGVIPLLRRFADREVVRRLFRRLCELAPIIAVSKPGDNKQAEAKIARQLQELLRGMPPEVVIDSILLEVGESKDGVEINSIAAVYNVLGHEGAPLREGLPAPLMERFHSYLRAAIDTVLAQDDPHGGLKAYFATVLAQVGDASDLPDLERLVGADLMRIRAERAAQKVARPRPRRRPNP
jgi:hypothetical protein